MSLAAAAAVRCLRPLHRRHAWIGLSALSAICAPNPGSFPRGPSRRYAAPRPGTATPPIVGLRFSTCPASPVCHRK
eukprot:5410973-Lingulodinium_polyedra.AAC.1